MTHACSRPGCSARAVAQLSYEYAASRVEVGPLEADLEPNTYALCQAHLDKLRVPKGWALVTKGVPRPVSLNSSQLDALAAAIRRAGGVGDMAEESTISGRENLVTLAHRAHLRVVADSAQYASAG